MPFICYSKHRGPCGTHHPDLVEALRCSLAAERDMLLSGHDGGAPHPHRLQGGQLVPVGGPALKSAWQAVHTDRMQVKRLRSALGHAAPPGIDILDEDNEPGHVVAS